MKNKKEVVRFLELIANSVGETITEHHWREACGLIAGIDPYKEDAPTIVWKTIKREGEVVYQQMDKAYMQPYDKAGVLYNLFKWEFPWLEKTDGKECLDFKSVHISKIPFESRELEFGDRIENETEDILIFDGTHYTFVNTDHTRFLSDDMIYQEWAKIRI